MLNADQAARWEVALLDRRDLGLSDLVEAV
jgi:hypothetical protein